MRQSFSRTLIRSVLALIVFSGVSTAEETISIMVDGQPLDAKAVAIRDEVYVPAWILENYAHTKVDWLRGSNLLEIHTTAPALTPVPSRGKVRIKIGVYLESQGFVVGRTTRLYVLNIDPKEFRFSGGKSPSVRAHEAAIERIGAVSQAMHKYLELPPTERFSPKGWKIVSAMPDEEIATITDIVGNYELLYKSLYYDLMTNLVIQKEQQLNESAVIDDSMKGVKIENVPVKESGSAEIDLANGFYFLYARMLYRNRQIVWNLPITVRGGETAVELSNRNAAIVQ
jgi:hypothetical protein